MKGSSQDLKRILQIAGWMWLIYLLLLGTIDSFMYPAEQFTKMLPYYWINGGIAVFFLILANWHWIQAQMKGVYVPLMLFIIAGMTITANGAFTPPLPPGPLSNVEGLTLRLLPVLFIGLVIAAWHYSWPVIIFYALGTAALDLTLLLLLNRSSFLEPQILVTIIRTISFLVVGYFISRLMSMLHRQQEELSITNNRLAHHASTLENLTVSRERNRMSRELHDTVVHTLSGLSVQLETARAYWDVEPDTAKTLVDKSLNATRDGLQETRRALKSLRASPLEDLGLYLAIEKLCEDAAKRGSLKLELTLPERALILSPDVEQCVYRICQEGIENILHHANARHLKVSLSTDMDTLRLLIKDDGIGFDTSRPAEAGHYGLAGMQERAELAGGKLKIESKAGQGTQICLEMRGYGL